MKNKKNRFFALASMAMTIILTMGAVTACGGSSTYSAGGAMYKNEAIAETAAAMQENGFYDMAPAPASATMDMWEGEYAAEDMIDYDVPLSSPQGNFDTGATNGSVGLPDNANRKLIRTVYLNVETTDFDNLLASIRQSASEIGGYIEQSDISGSSITASSSGRRYASLTVRIPSDHLDPFLSQINEQSNVTNRSENLEDVTLQYSDIESRKKTLTVEQDRLWALLEKADTLEAVIALEARLSEIRYELESYESRLRLYDNQIDYSTVHINIDEVKVFTPTSPDSIGTRIQKGFSRNLEGVINGLINFAVGFLSSLPTIILLLIIFGIMIMLGRLLYKLIKKKILKMIAARKEKAKPVPPTAAEPTAQQPPQEKP